MNKTFVKIAAALAIGLAITKAEAKYLYAMVGDAEDIYNTTDNRDLNFNYAELKGYNGSDWTYFYYYTYQNGEAVKSTTPALSATGGQGNSTGAVYFDIGGSGDTYQTFMFELYTSSQTGSERVGWQQYSLATILNSGAIYENVPENTTKSAFTVHEVIPEPTSGILLLLGMAGLALRRRKA